MNKRVFGFGLLLLIVGIALVYTSVQSVFSNIPNYISATQSIAIKPGSDFFVPIAIRNESLLEIVYNASFPVDFFLINSTAHGMLLQANSTLIENATYLRGNGLVYEIDNSTHGMFPYVANISLAQKPTYWRNNQTLYLNGTKYVVNSTYYVANGTYYGVFQNYENRSNTVFYSVLNRSVASLSSSESGYAYGNPAFSISGTLAVMAGLIAMFYSFFTKSKNEEKLEDEEVERAYSSFGRKRAVKRKRPVHRKAGRTRAIRKRR